MQRQRSDRVEKGKRGKMAAISRNNIARGTVSEKVFRDCNEALAVNAFGIVILEIVYFSTSQVQ